MSDRTETTSTNSHASACQPYHGPVSRKARHATGSANAKRGAAHTRTASRKETIGSEGDVAVTIQDSRFSHTVWFLTYGLVCECSSFTDRHVWRQVLVLR